MILAVIFTSCESTLSSSTSNAAVSAVRKKIPYKEWLEVAKEDIRLYPKYGNKVKTPEQIEADRIFLKTVIDKDGSADSASNHYFLKACDYLNHDDLQTAMYRLNQAWMLNPKNPDVFRGFGWVYNRLEQYQLALEQFEEGLTFDPKNEELLLEKSFVERRLKEAKRPTSL
ncbi:MAG: hypothetical protein P0Y49_12365 [Candidatus Pedobacter colombiensis]|uniref:Tetratricopeptide repeat protein n=1 Tax=Candidatus Pedobacter colombiensis TaxID=3121371 RepID=A0AAJ5W3W6_9SPHI|nr:hypothetical protein [Pedobacter sp.]WEK17589.1 MAG: hypothetical protein P0Y49_12365 [Pedobacter sp.]